MTPPKMKDSTAKVLVLLHKGPQTTGDFAREFCPRASARIYELRKIWGCVIDAERIKANAYRFTLVYEPDGLPVDGKTVSPLGPPAVDRGAEHPRIGGLTLAAPAGGEDEPSQPAASSGQLFDTVAMEADAMFGFGNSEAA